MNGSRPLAAGRWQKAMPGPAAESAATPPAHTSPAVPKIETSLSALPAESLSHAVSGLLEAVEDQLEPEFVLVAVVVAGL